MWSLLKIIFLKRLKTDMRIFAIGRSIPICLLISFYKLWIYVGAIIISGSQSHGKLYLYISLPQNSTCTVFSELDARWLCHPRYVIYLDVYIYFFRILECYITFIIHELYNILYHRYRKIVQCTSIIIIITIHIVIDMFKI